METRFRLPLTSCAPSFIGALASSSNGALAVGADESNASFRDAVGMVDFGAISVLDDDDDDDADDNVDDAGDVDDGDAEEAGVDVVYIDDGCEDASATSGSDARAADAIPERIKALKTDLALGIG
jgi:hypothetical protein